MRRSMLISMLGLLAAGIFATQVVAQEAGGPPKHGDAAQNGGPGGPGGPPGAVHLIPRFVVDKLNLTKEQQDQVAALEKDTKEKLDKILTADQKKTLDEARPPRRGEGGGPGGGPGGGQGGDRPKGPPPGNN